MAKSWLSCDLGTIGQRGGVSGCIVYRLYSCIVYSSYTALYTGVSLYRATGVAGQGVRDVSGVYSTKLM